MKKEQQMVREFHEQAKCVISNHPELPGYSCRELRLNLIGEELVELSNAMGFECQFDFTDRVPQPKWTDLTSTADAIGDLLYVVLGTAVSCGIDIEPIFHEIHRSNMSKFVDGTFRQDGKYVKGPNYSPANLSPILNDQLAG